MIMANLTIELKKNVKSIDREYGRFISKDLANYLTNINNKRMLAFYPSMVNVYSIELVVEFIGNNHHHNEHIDFDEVRDMIEEQVYEHMPEFKTKAKSMSLKELAFTEAAVKMIYCYKQDDYLIPDSDPATIMSLENMYERAEYIYNGRFMPFIKLWADLVGGATNAFTGMMVDDSYSLENVAPHKAYEYQAMSMQEVNVAAGWIDTIQNNNFRPYNKFYKLLVTNRTMIPVTLKRLVDTLYDKRMLATKAIYVVDLVHIFTAATNDPQFLDKLGVAVKELYGSTLVIFIDMPNHFLKNNKVSMAETDALQKEDHEIKNDLTSMDKTFYDRMSLYNLMDIEDSLDWPVKADMMRKLVNRLGNNEGNKKTADPAVSLMNSVLMNAIRNMNVVLAYTDTLAYKQDFVFKEFNKLMKYFSIHIEDLSNPTLSSDQLKYLALSTICEYYNIKDLDKYPRKDELIKNIEILVNERTNKHDGYSSLYGFRYLARDMFEYRFQTDIEDNVYFESYISKRAEKLKEAKNLTDEKEKKAMLSQYESGDYGNIDPDLIMKSGYGGMFDSVRGRTYNTEVNTIELDKMIGLKDIKQQVYKFANFVEINKIKEKMGLKPIPISKHMVFMGNPGTAKTTVAIQLGKILHAKGLIPTADVKWVSRDDLVGMYVGHSARHTKEAIEGAKGGILFVDEAYSLTSTEGGTNSYGQEVVNTFVNYMDKPDIRDSTIIIFAGYKDEMKRFIDSNPGLKSRIGFYFDFPDYSTDELIEIARVQAKEAEYELEDGYLEKLRTKIEESRGAKDFGNGRFVRNIFEKSVLQQATRISEKNKNNQGIYTTKELITVTADDFSTEGIDVWGKNKSIGFTQMR